MGHNNSLEALVDWIFFYFSLGVSLLRFPLIFAMDRSDIVTLPIFDLRQCYLSLFTFRDQVAESTFRALVAESIFRILVMESTFQVLVVESN